MTLPDIGATVEFTPKDRDYSLRGTVVQYQASTNGLLPVVRYHYRGGYYISAIPTSQIERII